MNQPDLIDRLVELADSADQDRAPLATLRRGLSGEPRDLARVYPYVLPYAPKGWEAQQAYLDTACLFGLHPTKSPERPGAVSLGKAMRTVRDKTGSESIEARLLSVLQSHRDELPDRIRHCVSLAKTQDIKLQWKDILTALLYWQEDGNKPSSTASPRTTQRRWASDFWGQ